MSVRLLLAAAAVLLLVPTASAQTPPSEARIRADVLAEVHPSATSVSLRGNGSRQLNDGVWEFVHSITARKPFPEMPGVEIESYGDVVYQSHGSTYRYDRYRTGDWRYFGIPDPSPAEIQALLDTDPARAYPHGTLDADRTLTVLTDEPTYWHNPESVTVRVRMRSKQAVSNTEVAETETVQAVRMYREERAGPWTSFITTRESQEEIGRASFSADAVRAMRTLRDAAAIAQLEAEAAALPEVSVPDFQSGDDLARFVYQTLRGSDRATMEATLRAVLAPRHFVDEKAGALGIRAKMEILDPALTAALGGTSTFGDQTCAAPRLNEERTRRSANRTYFYGILDVPPRGNGASIALEVFHEEAPGGYRNGQRLPGRLVVGDLKVYTSQDADDLAYLASFDDPATACPGVAGQAAQDATQEARGTVEGAVQEGRRRLGRIFGRGGN